MEAQQTSSAHIGEMASEFMDYLSEHTAPGEGVMAAVVAVWTESGGVYWRVHPAEDAAERDAKGEGLRAAEVAEALGRDPHTVGAWLHAP